MKKGNLLALTAAVTALLTGVVEAADHAPAYTLNPVVVTATRTEKNKLDVPANVETITANQIKTGGYANAYEAVQKLAQLNVTTWQDDGMSYGGMATRMRARGLDNGTLVLLNGSPVNFGNQSGLGGIPIEQIDHIEVVKGAGSVLYGPQAMGGVVNVITKKPGSVDHLTGSVYGSIGNRYKDAGVNLQTELFNLGYKKFFVDDRLNMEKPALNGAGPALNLLDKKGDQMYLDFKLTDDLTASFGRTNNQATYESGKWKNFQHDPKAWYAGKSDITYYNYGLTYDSKENGWRAAASYNTMDVDVTYDPSYPKAYANNEYKAYQLNLDVQKRLKLRNDKDSLVLGTTLNRENWKYHKVGTDEATNGYNSYSFYQSYDHQFTDKYSMIFGLREYYAGATKYTDNETQILPQVQGLYKLNNNASLYFNVGKAFEMPPLNNFFSYSSNYVFNPDLKPQSSWSYEVGYKYEDDIRAFTADVFYMDVDNKFTWAKTDQDANILLNSAQWKNTGLELNYSQKLSDVQDASIGLTIQNPKGKSQNSDVWMQDAAKYVLNVGTTYHTEKFVADLRLFSYLKREWSYYRNDGNTTYSKPADHYLDNSYDLTLTLTYRPNDNDTFKLIGRNLLDREDTINTYQYVTTPANFIFMYERHF